uniref:Uncharacterized protein n=1 Tax=Poecilia latipinna TaxID=48699 RepID=A0A3B3U2M3_9TELE
RKTFKVANTLQHTVKYQCYVSSAMCVERAITAFHTWEGELISENSVCFSLHLLWSRYDVLHLLNDGETRLLEIDWPNGAWTSPCLSRQLENTLAQANRMIQCRISAASADVQFCIQKGKKKENLGSD